MSREPDIAPDIRDFVFRHLRSVVQLEVLLLLDKNQHRYWSPSAIAAELSIPTATAEEALERLASRNLLDIKLGNDVLYRFNPGSPSLRETVGRFIEFYGRQRIAVINLVVSPRRAPIRDFAEAFRLKKD